VEQGAGDGLGLGQRAAVHHGKVARMVKQAFGGGAVKAFDPRGAGRFVGAVAGRDEAGPETFGGVEHRAIGDLVAAAQRGAAPAHPLVEAAQLLVGQIREAVVAGEAVNARDDQAVGGAADFAFADGAGRAGIAGGPVALAVVGGLTHHQGAAFQLRRAAHEPGAGPGHFRRQARQAVQARRVQPAKAAKEIPVERHVPGDAFLQQQVAARGDAMPAAAGLNLAEVVFRHQLSHRQPEIVAEPGARRAGLGDQRRQLRGFQGIAAPPPELARQVGRPRQRAIGHRLEEKAHQRRFIREGGGEEAAQIRSEMPGIAAVGQFHEARRGLRQKQVGIRHFSMQVSLGVGALVQAVLGDRQHPPAACRRRPAQPPVPRLPGEVHLPGQVGLAGLNRKRPGQQQFSRGQRQRHRAAGGFGDGRQQAARLPFGMAAQRQAAGVAGRITPLVIKPEGKPGLPGRANRARERVPLGLAFEVVIEGNIANHAAKPLRGKLPHHLVLRRGRVRPRVNDFQDARLVRGLREPRLPTGGGLPRERQPAQPGGQAGDTA